MAARTTTCTSSSTLRSWSKKDKEIERLREENQALRNLADNLRPGPISQALQDSPDYSGQTIERLRAALKEKEERLESWYRTEAQIRCALLGLIEEDVYLKAIELIGKKSTDHNPHLSGDSSAPETKATVELAADTIRALMERHNFRHPLMSELGDLIRETFRMGVDAGRCYHSPQETTVPHVADLATGKHPDWCRGCAAEKASEHECRSAGPSGNAAGTGPVDTRAEARLSRREVTAQKASADCAGCGGKPEFPNIPCSICGRYPDGTSV